MKIIIVGCGRVGKTLAEQLVMENHEIVAIEKDPEILADFADLLDIMCIEGNGASNEVLEEAGAKDADLLIAVTPSDELNLLCCLIGKKLGVKSTIARVRNPEYSKEIGLIQEDLGLSMAINPEYTAAQEIARVIRFPSAIKVDSFAKGRVEIFKVRVNEKSPLNGLKIMELGQKIDMRLLICAVERGDEAIIPHGNFVIKEGDLISVVAPPKQIAKFFKWAGVLTGRIGSLMIASGGKIAYYLAESLLDDGIKVKIVEEDRARCEELSELLPKAVIINGKCADHELLMEEGVANVDAFAALTEIDEENVLLSFFADAKSDAKIITMVNSTSLREIVSKMPVGSLISPRFAMAERILRYVRAMQNTVGNNVESLCKLAENKVEALEFRVRTESEILGKPLCQLKLRKGLLIACINRKGKIITPGGQDTIELGDTVIVVTADTGLSDLKDILQG